MASVLTETVTFWRMGSRSAAAVSDEEASNVDEEIEYPVMKPSKGKAVKRVEESETEPTPEPVAEGEEESVQQDGTGEAEDEEDGDGVQVYHLFGCCSHS
jgi:hypothetical protein